MGWVELAAAVVIIVLGFTLVVFLVGAFWLGRR